ncbi:MAG: insulinase family protein [Zoogloeaceae bacterium]|jgi:zinc protease|nr:insulinase family protein [Zoogloeaceae bacterium]
MLKRFFLALVASFAVAFAAPGAQAEITIEHWQGRGGAKVFFVASRALPILDVQIDFPAGSMFELADKAGLASFVHSLLELGAGNLDESEISNRLADVGAALSGGVNADRASLSLRTLAAPEKQAAALEVFTQVLAAPRFESAIFERERARGIANLKDSLTQPGPLASRAFRAALYPAHPYGRLTTPESLAALTVEDARAFWQRHYVANNAVLSIVGDLDRQAAEALADQLLAALSEGDPVVLPAAPSLPAAADLTLAHPASQAHIYLGLPAIASGDPDFFPFLVGNYTLGGGGFVSRLMTEIREKRGYAYSVYSTFRPQKQAGPFLITLETKKEQAGEALALARKILADFLAHGPTPAELEAAKAYLSGSFPLNLDGNRKILAQIAAIGFYDLPLDYLARYQERIRSVQAADVRAVFARRVALENLVSVTVGAEGPAEEKTGQP